MWQRDLVDEIFRGSDRTPIEGGDPAREGVDEAVQLRVRKCPVDVSVSFRGVAVEVVGAENDFERAAAPDQQWEAFGTAAARDSLPPRLPVGPVACSRATRTACRRRGRTRCSRLGRSLGFLAMLTTGDLVSRTNVSIRIGRPEGPTALMMFPSCRSNRSGQGRTQDSRSRIRRHAGSGWRPFEQEDPGGLRIWSRLQC